MTRAVILIHYFVYFDSLLNKNDLLEWPASLVPLSSLLGAIIRWKLPSSKLIYFRRCTGVYLNSPLPKLATLTVSNEDERHRTNGHCCCCCRFCCCCCCCCSCCCCWDENTAAGGCSVFESSKLFIQPICLAACFVLCASIHLGVIGK